MYRKQRSDDDRYNTIDLLTQLECQALINSIKYLGTYVHDISLFMASLLSYYIDY